MIVIYVFQYLLKVLFNRFTPEAVCYTDLPPLRKVNLN